MSDENIVDLTKKIKEEKSNKAPVGERILNCYRNSNCKCMYCDYKEHAAQMAFDFIARDMYLFEEKQGAQLSTFDLKDVMFRAIKKVKELEKEMDESEQKE